MTKILLKSFSASTQNLRLRSLGIGRHKYLKAFLIIICAALTSFPVMAQTALDLPITFDDTEVDYDLNSFGGTISAMLDVDPTDENNTVLSVTKDVGSDCWAGTTVGNTDPCLANSIPFDAENTTMQVDVFSRGVGLPYLLKVEDCNNGGIASEVLAFTTVADAWETLSFDFTTGCANPINLANTYSKVSVFPNYACATDACGVTNPGTPIAFDDMPYYFDNIRMAPAPPAELDLPITFDDTSVDYDLNSFGGGPTGAISAMLAVDPADPDNTVLSVIKNAGSDCWAGTTVGNTDPCLANPIPFDAENTTMQVDVFSRGVGLPYLLKVEDCNNGGISSEVLAFTTVADAWETLSFDFTTGCANPINLASTYSKVSVFPNYACATDACGASNPGTPIAFDDMPYYFDNIRMAETVVEPAICTGNVSIENLTLGMDYSITSDADGNVEVVVTVLDEVDGLVAFYGGAGNPISFPAPGTRTFTYTFTDQPVGEDFVVDIFFNWAGAGGNSETITVTVGEPCDGASEDVTCTGNVQIENLTMGMDYSITSDADGNVEVVVTVLDMVDGLVAFYGGPGNEISFPAPGTRTFTYNFTDQPVGEPFVVDIFFNWAGAGGSSETITVLVGGDCDVPDPEVEFCVDVSCLPDVMNVNIFGQFNDFCAACTPLSDTDGDGIFCTTLVLPPGDQEYLFILNGTQESFAEGEPCTVSNFGFTNRLITVTGPTSVTFGFNTCEEICVIPPPAPELPITFDDPEVDYNLTDFNGTSSMIGPDPDNPDNMIVCTTKSVGAATFAGTTIGSSGFENPIPLADNGTVITVDILSPAVGVPILLKLETELGNAGPTAEVIIPTTTSMEFETLAFDFSTDPTFDIAAGYDRIVIFYDFGTVGTGQTFCFDNIMFCDSSIPPVIMCPEDVTIDCDASMDPDNTGMATATDLCSDPDISFTDDDDQGTSGCGQYSYTITRTWRATDNAGITATCEQIIMVQDNTAPIIDCPMDVSGSCTDSTLPTDTGMATATDNCSAESEIVISSTDETNREIDGCGAATFSITRTWTATDACGNTATCIQTISIADTEGPMVDCPDNQMLACDTDPLPIANTIDEFIAIGGTASDNCSALSELTLSVSDSPSAQSMLDFCPSASEADRTLTRTYTVTDACGNTSTCQQLFVYESSQNGPVITEVPLNQTVDCVVNAFPQLALFSAEGDCSSISYTVSEPTTTGEAGCPGTFIRYTYTATDVCGRSDSYVQTYTIANDGPEFVCPAEFCNIECPADLDARQAQFDAYAERATVTTNCVESTVSITNNFNPNGFINQNCMNPTIAVDNASAYQIVTFFATDNCGRSTSCTSLVVITDNEAPVISGTVSPGVADCNDADLQGEYSTWANFQLTNTLSATDGCTSGAVSLSYAPLTANVDCASGAAVTEVTFTATDACGNVAFTTANYLIIDNGPGEPVMATVSGTLRTEEFENIEMAEVEVNGFIDNMMVTSSDGYYQFDLLTSQNYAISPRRNDNPLNGITTYDLILLGQHLLEINLLESPYKMIAADVNESGSITALDLIELRRMILLIDEEFSAGKSWTFVDANYIFPQLNNPFATTYPTIYNINSLTTGEIADFIGIKLGDLNASASPGFLQSGDTRSNDGSLNIKLEDEMLKAGQTYQLDFNASDFKDVAGFQFTLDFAADYLEVLDYEGSELSKMSADNFGFTKADQGKITVSWNETTAVDMANNATLFQMSFTALKDVQLSEVLTINSSLTTNEAYQADLRKEVTLDFGKTIGNLKGYALLQNQPNPFAQETNIGFQLPEATEATLTIYDVSGRVVYTKTNTYDAGVHQVMMDKADLGATGVMYYQLSTPEFTDTKKMIVLK